MSATKKHLKSLARVIDEIINGLQGKPFAWGSGERSSKTGLLYEIGVDLVTETAARKIGHKLKRGARPVGSVRSRPVYVLHIQTKKDGSGHKTA